MGSKNARRSTIYLPWHCIGQYGMHTTQKASCFQIQTHRICPSVHTNHKWGCHQSPQSGGWIRSQFLIIKQLAFTTISPQNENPNPSKHAMPWKQKKNQLTDHSVKGGPALHYHMWLGTSGHSLHRLDNRRNISNMWIAVQGNSRQFTLKSIRENWNHQ